MYFTHTHTHTHTHAARDVVDHRFSSRQKEPECMFLSTLFVGTDADVLKRSGPNMFHFRICTRPCSRKACWGLNVVF